MKPHRRWKIALVLLLLLSPSAADNASEANGKIVGRVINQRGQQMPNLQVKLMLPRGMKDKFPTTQPIKGGKNAYIEATTNSEGHFAFEKLPAGEYVVISELDGTGRGRVVLTLGKNQTISVQVVLTTRTGEKQ